MVSGSFSRPISRKLQKQFGQDLLVPASPFESLASQRALDGAESIYGTPIGSVQVLASQETYGDYRQPRAATMLEFDGSDDYLLRSSAYSAGDFTIAMWISPRNTTGALVGTSATGTYIRMTTESSLVIRVVSTNYTISLSEPLYVNQVCHLTVTRSGSTVTAYKNGVSIGSVTAASSAFSIQRFGMPSTASLQYRGLMAGIKLYGVAKTGPQVAAIAAERGTCNDVTDLVDYWPLCEESGTTAYDAFGSNDLTLTGGPTWTTSTQLAFNPANVVGHTLTGSVVIPRDEANPALDAAGGSLEYTGTAPNPIAVNRPCLTFDGTGYVAVTGLVGTETVTASSGTSTLSVAAGRVNGTAGTCFGFTLSSGHQFTCEEGSGTVLYNVGTGNDGTLTSFSGEWAAKTNQSQSWRVLYGGRLSSGAFVPGLPNSSLCADGEPKTLAAGKVCADGGLTEIDFNPFSKAENNGLYLDRNYTTGTRADVRPFNRNFARVGSDGVDRLATTASRAMGSTRESLYSYSGITYSLQKVAMPSSFINWGLCNVFKKVDGSTVTYMADIQPTDAMPTTDQTLYVSSTGNNSNDGLTVGNAKLTIAGALSAATGIPRVVIGAGTFTATVAKSCVLVGAGPTTIITGCTISSGIRVAFESLKSTGTISNGSSTMIINDADFEVTGSDATNTTGTGKTYIFDSRAAGCSADVFNYNGTSQSIEVRVETDGNGTVAGHNGSTCHNDAHIVRIESTYNDSPNPIHDVNASKAVMFGCVGSNGSEGFNLGVGSSAIATESTAAWAYRCDFRGNPVVDISVDDDGLLYVIVTQYDTTSASAPIIESDETFDE